MLMACQRGSIKITVSDTARLYPPLWGGPKRIWNLYSNLGDMFDITYVGTDPGDDKRQYINRKIKGNFREVIQPISDMYYLFRDFEVKIMRKLTFDIFTYLCMWFDKGFKKELNRYDADILIASHPWSSPCFKIKEGQIFIYDAHNCEYLLMKEILKGKWYRWVISFFVRRIERAACKKAKIIIVTSEKDKESFVKLYKISEDKILILPNGTCIGDLPSRDRREEITSRLKRKGKDIILFVGAYYNPNIEAARFIVEAIAEDLKDIDIVIVGTVGDYFKNNNIPENVRLAGRVTDSELYEWLTVADIAINPMFIGSGINIKMLDYFSFGLPVIATPVGARGIEGIDSRDFVVCDKEGFIDMIRQLLGNESLRCQMGKNSRRLAEELYDWRKISAKFSCIIEGLVENNGISSIGSDRRNLCWRNQS